MSHPGLLPYWPATSSVENCIRAEAEAVDEAVFLAVHHPSQFVARRVGGSPEGEVRGEKELLDAFMDASPPEGRVILPILGASGVGKSHVIRWLDAQLRRHPRKKRLHVIRIPKGASLKRVLRLILEGLEGPAYDDFRKALRNAHEQLDPELAAKHLLTNLSHQVVLSARAAKARIADNQSEDPARDKIRRDYGGRGRADEGLPALLTDPVLGAAHFLGSSEQPGIVARLAEHVTHEGGRDVDERRHQFEADDLVIADELIPKLSAPARQFYTAVLMKESGQHRDTAASLLNEVLDAAKQDLLRLGDNSLTDLFADVRVQLLVEGKELVLLVEDFAVLSGLQGALLDVMIREAFRDGKQVLCTIRSALAYTEGYLKQTVRTRARVEWYISETFPQGDVGVFDRAVELVGGYLNAARLGIDRIDAKFSESPGASVPRFEHDLPDDAATLLDAFGASSAGVPLFPFNREAIERLVVEGSRDSVGRPVFNPRNIINNVLHTVLRLRPEFERGHFPPETFGSIAELPTDVSGQLMQSAGKEWKRYARVVGYWGGLLLHPGDASPMSPEIYQAFGLTALAGVKPREGGKNRDTPPNDKTVGRKTKSAPPPPPTIPPSPPKDPWEARLMEWHRGELFPQADANQLRQWIASGIMGFIPWDVHLLKPSWDPKELAELIFIPGTRHLLKVEDAALVVCSEADRLDEERSVRVRSTLLAIIRYETNGRSWDYDSGRDSARYANFMAERAAGVVDFLRKYPHYGNSDLVRPTVEALLVGARCLGAEVASNSDDAALVHALFEDFSRRPPAEPVEGVELATWDKLTRDFAAIRGTTKSRPSAGEVLLELVGARRGNSVQAIDVAALLPALKAVKKSWKLETRVEAPSAVRARRLATFASELQTLRVSLPAAVAAAEKALQAFRTRALAQLGESFDKNEAAQTFGALLDAIVDVGIVGMQPNVIRGAIKKFQESSATRALDDVGKLDHGKSFGPAIGVLASLDRPALSAIADLLAKIDALLRDTETAVEAEFASIGPDPVEIARQSLMEELDGIRTLVAALQGVVS